MCDFLERSYRKQLAAFSSSIVRPQLSGREAAHSGSNGHCGGSGKLSMKRGFASLITC